MRRQPEDNAKATSGGAPSADPHAECATIIEKMSRNIEKLSDQVQLLEDRIKSLEGEHKRAQKLQKQASQAAARVVVGANPTDGGDSDVGADSTSSSSGAPL